MQKVFSDHSEKIRKILRKYPNIWKVNKALLNNTQVKEKTSKRKFGFLN